MLNALNKLELEPLLMIYRRGTLDIQGEEAYRNYICKKCERIPVPHFKAVVARLLKNPPKRRPDHRVFFAVWKAVQIDLAAEAREKLRQEKAKRPEPPRFAFSQASWDLLEREIAYLKDRKKREADGLDDPEAPFI